MTESISEKLARFEKALQLFLDRVRADSNLLAAVLVGSLSEETVWRRDAISLWLIEKDGVTKRLRADGEDPRIFRSLVEEGVNLHVELIPRSRFKRMVEGSARTAFCYSFFARRKLVYCDDPSLRTWFEDADTLALRDQERELCIATTWLIHAHRHAAHILENQRDLELAFQTLLGGAHCVAAADKTAVASTVVREIDGRLDLLIGIGLDYLNLSRRSSTLSGGESQRIRLSTQIGSGLMGMLYVLDEPSIGLHAKDNVKMIRTLERLRDLGNTVIVVEHDEETIRAADWLVEIGPGPGIHGGEVVAQGPPAAVLANARSLTGAFLLGEKRIPTPEKRRAAGPPRLRIRGARHNNLQNLNVEIPLGMLVCVTGASGSGKSSLVHEIIFKKLASLRYDSRILSGAHDGFEGHESVDDVINIDQSAIGRSPRSNPATYVGIYDSIRELFAQTDEAKARGFGPARFSFNVKGGRCEECAGDGTIVTQLSFMPDVEVTCPACKGRRYREETLEVTWRGRNIAEVLKLSIEEGVAFFADQRGIVRKLEILHELGLGYLELGHAATILSGGEAQRVKLAAELGKMRRGRHNLYILDEPTTGLHLADIQRLLDCLQRLVKAGHSVLVIEHHLDVVKCADWILDLGPEGGHQGGQLIVAGTPEMVAACERSYTGLALRAHLDSAIAG